MSEALLAVTGLCLERGGRLLVDKLDLEVRRGEMLLVEGANGSGKTTLLRSLAGLSRLGQTGDIRRNTHQLLFLGHRPGIKQLLTARENLEWHCRAHGYDPAGAENALAQVGLYGYEDVLCHTMSAGQQRRVNLARLYLGEAELCLLDEPFTAIDRDGVRALTQLLADRVQGGAAVVLTSHQDLPLDIPLRRLTVGGTE
jgi:heme exporter protein A